MYLDYFDQFKNMSPYLHINAEQWKHIQTTFEKADVCESLAKLAMEYPLPYQEISEDDARKEYLALKKTRWNELLKDDEWFIRKAGDSRFGLGFEGKQLYFRRVNTGNQASNYFQQANRWGVDGTVSPGPDRTWRTYEFMVTLMGAMYTLKFDEINRGTLRVALSLRKYICSQFKPNVAKALYDYFKAETILDFAAGWGDRMCGFYASETGKHYVGIDPRKENHPIYRQQAEFYEKNNGFFEVEKKADFVESPAEDFDYAGYDNYFDIAFTSPPYFSVERYSYDDTQSWVRYKTIDEWNEQFLHKALGKIWKTLKKGGVLIVNIADVYASSKGTDKGYRAITTPMNEYLEKQEGAEYLGCMGMEMAKRPGSAGAGAIIEGDEGRYTEEALEKAREAADKTFCEPMWVWRKN
jgi:SAM-dependent methyltransferase